jgi:hypothetical protein
VVNPGNGQHVPVALWPPPGTLLGVTANCPFSPMPFSTADISVQLLMDTTNTLQKIESRMTARAFGGVHYPEKGPEVRRVLEELLEVPDRTSPDGVI